MTEQPPAQSTENEARRLDADRIQAALRYYLPPGENQDAALAALARILAALAAAEGKLGWAQERAGIYAARVEAAEASVRGLIEASVEREAKLREYEELRKAVAAYLDNPIATFNPGFVSLLLACVDALIEARPYVYSRMQESDDWRSETAQSVLSRIDLALAALSNASTKETTDD